MSVKHPEDLLAAFALDALTDEEGESVRSHLVECDQCRRDVGRFRTTIEVLPLSIADAPMPSPDLRGRILREAARTAQVRFASEVAPVPLRSMPRRRSAIYGWLAAAALLVAVLGLGARDFTLSRELQTLSRPTTQQGEMIATVNAPGADGRYTLGRNRDGLITVVNLPPPAPGQVYEAWVIDASGPKPAGTFVTTPDGQGTVELTRPASPGTTIAITNEPSPGTQSPSGNVLLKAKVA